MKCDGRPPDGPLTPPVHMWLDSRVHVDRLRSPCTIYQRVAEHLHRGWHRDGIVSDCGCAGVLLRAGATAKLRGLTVTGCAGVGLSADGHGAVLIADGCTVKAAGGGEPLSPPRCRPRLSAKHISRCV